MFASASYLSSVNAPHDDSSRALKLQSYSCELKNILDERIHHIYPVLLFHRHTFIGTQDCALDCTHLHNKRVYVCRWLDKSFWQLKKDYDSLSCIIKTERWPWGVTAGCGSKLHITWNTRRQNKSVTVVWLTPINHLGHGCSRAQATNEKAEHKQRKAG